LTAPWLSDAWFATAAEELSGVRGPPTLVGSVTLEVTGASDGDLSCHATFAAGRIVSSGPGPVPDPDVTFTLTDGDARAVVTGDLDASVAFMQGRMKVAGAMSVVLDVLALAGTDDVRKRLDRVSALTDF
jgi:putative sterol carrier protein